MTKQGMHLLIYFLKSVANDIINVSLFAGPVYCETRHRRVEALCRPLSTLKADILNITYGCYSKDNNVEMTKL